MIVRYWLHLVRFDYVVHERYMLKRHNAHYFRLWWHSGDKWWAVNPLQGSREEAFAFMISNFRIRLQSLTTWTDRMTYLGDRNQELDALDEIALKIIERDPIALDIAREVTQ